MDSRWPEKEKGRLKKTWRRTVEAEMKQQGWIWGFLESIKKRLVII